MRLTKANAEKLARLRALANALPSTERARWLGAIKGALAKFRGAAIAGGPETLPDPSAKVQAAQGEWDLELANWLDSAYSAVADRAEELGVDAKEALGKAAGEAARAAVPWVAIVVVLAAAFYVAKR